MKLLEPIQVGKITLKNRIMFPPMTTGYEERDGSIGEQSFHFYKRLAQGGVAYIVLGDVAPVNTVSPTPKLFHDGQIEAYKKLADALHEYDCKLGIQLFHPEYDVDALAEFMEEYGFLGHHFLPTQITYQRFIELDSYLDKDVDYFEAITHFAWCVDDRYDDYFENPAPGFYRLLWHELKRIDDALREQQSGVPYSKKAFIFGVASIERVVETIKKWRRCATVIKLLIEHKNIADIAIELNLEVNQACDCLDGAVRSVNEHIGFLSPTIEVYDEERGYSLMGMASDRDAVGLEEAIAVQLWRFSLEAKEGYSICRECGRMFVRKRSKTAKAASRSTSQFCCDRCKNRNAQRRHRKSPGYLLKRSSK